MLIKHILFKCLGKEACVDGQPPSLDDGRAASLESMGSRLSKHPSFLTFLFPPCNIIPIMTTSSYPVSITSLPTAPSLPHNFGSLGSLVTSTTTALDLLLTFGKSLTLVLPYSSDLHGFGIKPSTHLRLVDTILLSLLPQIFLWNYVLTSSFFLWNLFSLWVRKMFRFIVLATQSEVFYEILNPKLFCISCLFAMCVFFWF